MAFTISLNGVVLNENIVWENEFDHSDISQTTKRTILGTSVVQQLPKESGRLIVLSTLRAGSTFSGYFTRSQIEQIKELERNTTVVDFVYGSRTFEVYVQSEGVSVVPLQRGKDFEDDDIYTGAITLVEV